MRIGIVRSEATISSERLIKKELSDIGVDVFYVSPKIKEKTADCVLVFGGDRGIRTYFHHALNTETPVLGISESESNGFLAQIDLKEMISYLQRIKKQDYVIENVPRIGVKIDGLFAGPSLALMSSIIYGIWSYTGYYAIILLAGLSIIPSDLYEAAKVEGASRWQTFIKITIPLLMPIIFFLMLTGFINTFQAFNSIFVMQTSSAGDTMDVVTVEIFDHFWGRVKYGYAAAEGVILFILLNVLAISQYVIFRKRLNYE